LNHCIANALMHWHAFKPLYAFIATSLKTYDYSIAS
jgi:hypothetical protein